MTDRPREKDSNVLQINSRNVTQQDLIEYLSLKILYEKKRDAIAAAIKSGAHVEPGVHSVFLESELIVR